MTDPIKSIFGLFLKNHLPFVHPWVFTVVLQPASGGLILIDAVWSSEGGWNPLVFRHLDVDLAQDMEMLRNVIHVDTTSDFQI